jgi:hypothetical protein
VNGTLLDFRLQGLSEFGVKERPSPLDKLREEVAPGGWFELENAAKHPIVSRTELTDECFAN